MFARKKWAEPLCSPPLRLIGGVKRKKERHSFEIRRNFPIFQSLSLELELVSIFWKEEKRMRSDESKIPWIDVWNFILNSDDFRSIFEY